MGRLKLSAGGLHLPRTPLHSSPLPCRKRQRLLPPLPSFTSSYLLSTSPTLSKKAPLSSLQPTQTPSSSPSSSKHPKPRQNPPRPTLLDPDIQTAFLKGSGPGGQKINKTASAVQLTHLPTGIVVKCQETRSQTQNSKIARRILAEKVDIELHGERSWVAERHREDSRRKGSGDKKRRRKYRRLEEEKEREREKLRDEFLRAKLDEEEMDGEETEDSLEEKTLRNV